jgi:hypothetical protein
VVSNQPVKAFDPTELYDSLLQFFTESDFSFVFSFV